MSELKLKKFAKKPRHVAVIMDGNGRWANKRFLPRFIGHKYGITAVKELVNSALLYGIEVLTLFAFSSENWQRSEQEVSYLLNLSLQVIRDYVAEACQKNIRILIIGDLSKFDLDFQAELQAAICSTAQNTGLKLLIALNYGGRWDLVQAMRKIAALVVAEPEKITQIDENLIEQYLSTGGLPAPDLFIRTSGEQRMSNFLIWQLSYTEFYFTKVLWPDFKRQDFEEALQFYSMRQRRFGREEEQLTTD